MNKDAKLIAEAYNNIVNENVEQTPVRPDRTPDKFFWVDDLEEYKNLVKLISVLSKPGLTFKTEIINGSPALVKVEDTKEV